MKWGSCLYLGAGDDWRGLRRAFDDLNRKLFSLFDKGIDTSNLDPDAWGDEFVFSPNDAPNPTGGPNTTIHINILNPAGDSYIRKKGGDFEADDDKAGIEFFVDATDSTYGKVCFGDSNDLNEQQLISFAPESTATVTNPGATISTPLGTMIFEGRASDEFVFNESSIDVNFRVESNGNANAIFVDAGTDRVGILKVPAVAFDVAGKIRTDNQVESTIATGTAPLVVASTTVVANLNADKLDGYDASQLLDSAVVVGKPGDSSISSETSLGADSDLSGIALFGEVVYAFTGFIRITSPAAADFKWQWSYDGTLTSGGWAVAVKHTSGTSESTDISDIITLSTTGNVEFLIITGHIVAATGGSLSFTWAQNTSDVGDTTVHGGSWLRFEKMA